MIAAEQLGDLLHIDGVYCFGIGADELPPRWACRLPGGMLEDLLPHLIVTARALSGRHLTLEHWHLGSAARVAGERHNELRLLLTGTEGLTVQLTLSLSAQPKAFSLTARGTRATLSIDLRNMLFRLTSLRGRHRAIATAMELTGSAVGVIAQTAVNAIGILTGTRERHGSSYHLFRHHYAALAAGREIPAPLSQAVETVRIARTIWPL
jgi:predicted dehydrogenase